MKKESDDYLPRLLERMENKPYTMAKDTPEKEREKERKRA